MAEVVTAALKGGCLSRGTEVVDVEAPIFATPLWIITGLPFGSKDVVSSPGVVGAVEYPPRLPQDSEPLAPYGWPVRRRLNAREGEEDIR